MAQEVAFFAPRQDTRLTLCETSSFHFRSFSYACPEPVLTNQSVFCEENEGAHLCHAERWLVVCLRSSTDTVIRQPLQKRLSSIFSNAMFVPTLSWQNSGRFKYTMAQKKMFPAPAEARSAASSRTLQTQASPTGCKRRRLQHLRKHISLCLSAAFPTFVPSLSWQVIIFSTKWRKNGVSAPCSGLRISVPVTVSTQPPGGSQSFLSVSCVTLSCGAVTGATSRSPTKTPLVLSFSYVFYEPVSVS
jgi:hypothetical protein